MVATVGLLTQDALARDHLCEAEDVYRDRDAARRAERARTFRAAYCHDHVPVAFLGVFDTVGALGVPGLSRRRSRFHDLRLSTDVRCARQALAIDDRRITFEPCLWDVPVAMASRVKQVWFPGGHSDVGGGARARALSDTALLWMLGEAVARGLVVDEERLRAQLHRDDELVCRVRPGCSSARSTSSSACTTARASAARCGSSRASRPARDRRRRLPRRDGRDAQRRPASVYARHARNLGWWRDSAGPDLARVVEPVPGAAQETRPLALA